MEIATQTLIASTTAIATSTANIPEVSPWFSYIVDIILILVFLFILFFVKPNETPKEELSEEEKPNPLEKVLKTDSKEESESDTNVVDDAEQRD